jgi:hypothetical protein
MLTRFYFPRWNAAFSACWEVDRGTILARQLREEPFDPALPSATQVEAVAERLRGTSRLTADHLRHACHVVALGRDRSAKYLSAAECNRVVRLFDLLADPYNLTAVKAWLNPADDRRKQLLWTIENGVKLDAPYKRSICRDKFGTENWRTLNSLQLDQLAMTLRSRAGSKPVPA